MLQSTNSTQLAHLPVLSDTSTCFDQHVSADATVYCKCNAVAHIINTFEANTRSSPSSTWIQPLQVKLQPHFYSWFKVEALTNQVHTNILTEARCSVTCLFFVSSRRSSGEYRTAFIRGDEHVCTATSCPTYHHTRTHTQPVPIIQFKRVAHLLETHDSSVQTVSTWRTGYSLGVRIHTIEILALIVRY